MTWSGPIAVSFVGITWLLSGAASAQQQPVYISYSNPESTSGALRTDTMQVEHFRSDHVLIGTCVLHGSARVADAVFSGYGLSKVELTPCSEPMGEDPGSDHIVDVHSTDTTLTVDARVISTCGHDFLCEIELIEDSVINLVSTGYGSYAICPCCFGLRYSIAVNKDNIERPVRFVMVNGDRRTLKRLPS